MNDNPQAHIKAAARTARRDAVTIVHVAPQLTEADVRRIVREELMERGYRTIRAGLQAIRGS